MELNAEDLEKWGRTEIGAEADFGFWNLGVGIFARKFGWTCGVTLVAFLGGGYKRARGNDL